MIISEFGYKTFIDGSINKIKIGDLPNSNYKIIVSCDCCYIHYETIHSNRIIRLKKSKNDLCKSCSKKGINNSQYKKDRKKLCENARKYQTENPMKNKKHSEKSKQKMSEIKSSQIAKGTFNIKSNNRGRKGWYYSTKNEMKFYFDSLLEKFRMILLDNDNDVLTWTKNHGIRIAYEYKGNNRITVPDFLIEYKNGNKTIEEVKGWIRENDIAKKIATENYCINNNLEYIFLTQKQLNENGEYRKYIKEKN